MNRASLPVPVLFALTSLGLTAQLISKAHAENAQASAPRRASAKADGPIVDAKATHANDPGDQRGNATAAPLAPRPFYFTNQTRRGDIIQILKGLDTQSPPSAAHSRHAPPHGAMLTGAQVK